MGADSRDRPPPGPWGSSTRQGWGPGARPRGLRFPPSSWQGAGRHPRPSPYRAGERRESQAQKCGRGGGQAGETLMSYCDTQRAGRGRGAETRVFQRRVETPTVQWTTTGRVSTGRACLALEARGPYQEVAHGLPTEAARTRAGPASLLQEVVTPREPVRGSSLFLESLVGAHPLQEALSASPLSPGQLQQQ